MIYEQDRLRKELYSIYEKEKFDKGIQDKDKDDNGCNNNSLSDMNKSSTGLTNATASLWGKNPGNDSKWTGFSIENTMNVNDKCLDLPDSEVRNIDNNNSNSIYSGFCGENTLTENARLDLLDTTNQCHWQQLG